MGSGPQHPTHSCIIFVLQIEKFGDPNGIVQFSEDSLQERVYNESSEEEGPFNISLQIKRREGVMGNITVSSLYLYYILIWSGVRCGLFRKTNIL